MGSGKIWLESWTGWRADGAAYRAAAHTDSNSGWCRQHVVMLHPPSAAVPRSAYRHSANSQAKWRVHLVALIARSIWVSLWLKSTSFHLLQTGFMPTTHLAIGTCLTPALTNPQQTWSTSLQSDESLTSQTRFEIPPGHEIQRRR